MIDKEYDDNRKDDRNLAPHIVFIGREQIDIAINKAIELSENHKMPVKLLFSSIAIWVDKNDLERKYISEFNNRLEKLAGEIKK